MINVPYVCRPEEQDDEIKENTTCIHGISVEIINSNWTKYVRSIEVMKTRHHTVLLRTLVGIRNKWISS